MTKVLLHGSVPPPMTGVGVANEMVIKGLEHRGIEVYVIKKGENKSNKFLSWDGKFSISRVKGIIKECREISRTIKKYSVDVLYISVGQSKLGMLVDLLKMNISFSKNAKVVIHVHGGRLHESIKNLPPLFRSAYLKALRKCESIITLTDEQCKNLSEHGLENVIAINNGTNASEVCSDQTISNKFNRPIKELNVLYLSNMIETKGYRDIVRAATTLQNKIPEINFKFAGQWGSVNDKNWFDEYTQNINNCGYVGVVRREEKKDLYEWADIWVLPTYFIEEGLPISLLEAMWSGCAIVTTHYRGIPEAVNEEGSIFVNPKSPEDIVNAITKLYNDHGLIKQMGKANSIRARERFSEDVFVEKVINALNIKTRQV